MKIFLTLTLLTSLLPPPAFAADPTPTCVEEKIEIEKLKQANAKLVQQLMQAQFAVSQQQEQGAKAEEERLQKLLPVTGPPKPDKK